jgi:flagellar biosynthesis protein FlhA
MRLEPSEYCIKIKGVEVGRASIRTGQFMAINPGGIETKLEGEEARDPAFGLPALWITEDQRDKAERAGYTVVDSPSIIATHLTEIIKKHAWEMLGRQEMRKILDELKRDFPAVVEEVNKVLSLGEVQKVLQSLLAENVSIRNVVPILETLADYAPISKETTFLAEKARQTLGRQICLQFADDERRLHVLTIHPSMEGEIIESRTETASGLTAALEPALYRRWINAVVNAVHSVQQQGFMPIILCSEAARALVRATLLRELPEVTVLSVPEIPADIGIEPLGEIVLEERESA